MIAEEGEEVNTLGYFTLTYNAYTKKGKIK